MIFDSLKTITTFNTNDFVLIISNNIFSKIKIKDLLASLIKTELNKMFDNEMMNKFKDLLKHNDHKIVELEKQIFLLSKELENIQLELTNSNKNNEHDELYEKINVLNSVQQQLKSEIEQVHDDHYKTLKNIVNLDKNITKTKKTCSDLKDQYYQLENTVNSVVAKQNKQNESFTTFVDDMSKYKCNNEIRLTSFINDFTAKNDDQTKSIQTLRLFTESLTESLSDEINLKNNDVQNNIFELSAQLLDLDQKLYGQIFIDELDNNNQILLKTGDIQLLSSQLSVLTANPNIIK